MNPSPPPTSTEIALGKYVQGAWVAFARDPVNGLRNYGWPVFNPVSASLVQLGNVFNQSGATFGQSVLLDLPCNVTTIVLVTPGLITVRNYVCRVKNYVTSKMVV